MSRFAWIAGLVLLGLVLPLDPGVRWADWSVYAKDGHGGDDGGGGGHGGGGSGSNSGSGSSNSGSGSSGSNSGSGSSNSGSGSSDDGRNSGSGSGDDGDDDGLSADDSASGTGTTPSARPSRDGGDHDVVRDEIVALDDVARSHLPGLRRIGFRPIEERPLWRIGGFLVRLRVPAGQTPEAARALLRQRFPDLLLDVHQLYRSSGTVSLPPPDYPRRLVGWDQRAGVCTAGAIVGMIDTGLSAAARRRLGPRLVAADFAAPGDGDEQHGDAVATLLVGSGSTGGLMPAARLAAADVFEPGDDRGPVASVAAVARALDWMAAQHVPVVGLSFTGPDNAVLAEAARRAAQAGLIMVAAGGNDGPDAPPAYPAALPEVVAVTAVDHHRAVYDHANRGSYIGISAPGVRVPVSAADGTPRLVTGTSFAVPFVVAALAADSGRVTNRSDALRQLASQAIDLGAPGPDPVYGYGLVQAPRGCDIGNVSALPE
ncbi:S8 family serine peptidase [Inquilinus sp. YAF38]|uniref:S8 family serine peptidase n=1 Tax=Inquilinus sp. YAF38 TaxID=3233084 RepID=UPI003F913908